MERDTFDAVTRLFATGGSRPAALATVLGSLSSRSTTSTAARAAAPARRRPCAFGGAQRPIAAL